MLPPRHDEVDERLHDLEQRVSAIEGERDVAGALTKMLLPPKVKVRFGRGGMKAEDVAKLETHVAEMSLAELHEHAAHLCEMAINAMLTAIETKPDDPERPEMKRELRRQFTSKKNLMLNAHKRAANIARQKEGM